MAYTADQILIDGINIKEIDMLEIVCETEEHGVLKCSGYVEENTGEKILYGLEEYAPLSVYIKENGNSTLIFSGVITNLKVTKKEQTDYVKLEGMSRSWMLDLKKKSKSFQDVSMTYKELMEEILANYQGEFKISIPNQTLDKIAVQYKETDWEFLKRMMSMHHAPLSCNPASKTIQLYAGIPDGIPEEITYNKLEVRKELGDYYFWQQKVAGISDVDFLIYQVETEKLLKLFDRVICAGQHFLVKTVCYTFKNRLLYINCELQKTEGVLFQKIHPIHLIGVALEGKIIDVKRELVRIHLAIDDKESNDVYWFPSSTLFASTDESGWYYMPELGDRVRVCFPSKDTGDVFVMGAISTYDGKNEGTGGYDSKTDKMAVPSTKSLRNPYGQEITMGEDGVRLICKENAGVIKIGNDGHIAIAAQNEVVVQAENDIDICSETDLILNGSEKVVLSCSQGAQVILNEDGNLVISGSIV